MVAWKSSLLINLKMNDKPVTPELVVEIENGLYNYMLRSDSLSRVFDKGDSFILLILLGEELDFRGVALRNRAQLLDTVKNCKDLNFRTNVKTDCTRFSD